MKKTLSFLCLTALFLTSSSLFSQWDYTRNYKSFEKINLSGPLTQSDIVMPISDLSMDLWDASNLIGIGVYWLDSNKVICFCQGNIWKLNVKTGNSEILLDSCNPLYQSFKDIYLGLGGIISVWHDLLLTRNYNMSNGFYLLGKDSYLRHWFINDMLSQTNATEIGDCRFAPDGSLVGLARYQDKYGLIVSNDSGVTWKKQGNFIKEIKTLNCQMFIGENIGTIGIYSGRDYKDSLDYHFARTTDMGKTWNITTWDHTKLNGGWSIYKYLPSSTSASNDTLFVVGPSFVRNDTTFNNFLRSDNGGTDWKIIKVLPKRYSKNIDSAFNWGNIIIKSVNKIYIEYNDGIAVTINGGLSWTKYLAPGVRDLEGFKMFDDRHGVARSRSVPGRKNKFYLFELGICSSEGLEYSTLGNTTGLNLKGNARSIGDYVRLTESKAFQSGSMWYDKQLAFNRSFDAKFGFKLSEGVNGEDDKTSPGADGVSLVIAKEIPSAAGENGGGIGYNGVNSAIAIEFDSFINKDRSDPDYDHVGVFASSKTIENNHGSANCLGTARIPGELKANISKHNVTVMYEKIDKTLKVYFDSDNEFDTPLISIKDFDIEKYIGGPVGYIGITASTGTSMQNHYISDFSLCFNDETVLAFDEPTEQTATEEYAWPNPASEELKIKLPEKMVGNSIFVKIYNSSGNLVSSIGPSLSFGNTMQINLKDIPAGFYYAVLSDGNATFATKFIKN